MEEKTQQKKETWDWAKHRPNNMFNIPVGENKDFFKWWCVFLRPFVPLTPREIDVVAAYLKQRFKLKKVISDPAVLDSQLMSNDTKNEVIKECDITLQHYYVVMSSLRKSNVITPAGINPRLIPNINEGDTFQLLINFNGMVDNDIL